MLIAQAFICSKSHIEIILFTALVFSWLKNNDKQCYVSEK